MALSAEELRQELLRIYGADPTLAETEVVQPGQLFASDQPGLAPPTVATGQAPASDASPSIAAQQEQLLAGSRARAAALESGGGTSTAQKVGLGLSAVGDVATQLGNIRRGRAAGGPQNVDATLKGMAATGAKRQELIIEERKFQAELLNSIKSAGTAQLEAMEKGMGIAAAPAKNPGSRPEDLQAAAEQAIGVLTSQGGMSPELATRVVAGAQRLPDVSARIGRYGAIFDKTNPRDVEQQKVWLMQTGIAGGSGDPAKVDAMNAAHVVGKVGEDAAAIALAYAKDPQNAAKKGKIDLEDLLSVVRATKGPRAFAYEEYYRGTLPGMTDSARTAVQDALANLGYQRIDVAGKAQGAGATAGASARATLAPDIVAGQAGAAATKKAAELAVEGPALSQDVKDELAGAGIDVRKLDPKNPVMAAAIKAATDAADTRKTTAAVATASATGVEAERVRQGAALSKPVGAKDRSGYVEIAALQQTGDLVQPPAGITQGELDRSGRYAFVEDKQKEGLRGLKRSEGLLGSVLGLADRTITATTGEAAIQQAINFKANEYLARNPAAKTFVETRNAFTGNIARDMGGERGVLTDRDIERVQKAIPGPWDTVATKDLKKALIADLITVSRNALIAEVTGQPAAPHKRRLADLLDALDKVQSPGLEIESIRRKK